jgi:hypothetical protein
MRSRLLPDEGAKLTREELATVMRAFRDLVRYMDDDQSSMFRLRVEEIGTTIAEAIGRPTGGG